MHFTNDACFLRRPTPCLRRSLRLQPVCPRLRLTATRSGILSDVDAPGEQDAVDKGENASAGKVPDESESLGAIERSNRPAWQARCRVSRLQNRRRRERC